jgi:CheY-like chemotaxis protein
VTIHRALLIEDDTEQLEWMVPRIESRGFDVLVASTNVQAKQAMADTANYFDLIVVDRRIPHDVGDAPVDALGDELRVAVLEQYPDSRIMVFTAYPDLDQMQQVAESSGHIQVRGREINRLSLYNKIKLIHFEDAVKDFSDILNEIDDIEVVVSGDVALSQTHLRCIRRAAVEFMATRVEAETLVGGLTRAGVWRCNFQGDFASTGAVVVKASIKRPTIGGIANVLPIGSVASVNGVFEGLCYGMFVSVMQDVVDGVSFSQAYVKDSIGALSSLEALMHQLTTVQSAVRVVTLSDLVQPYCTWDEVARHLAVKGIVPPSEGMKLSASVGVRHGDLHMENILVTSTSAVLIDCDEPVHGALAVDVVGMLISTLTHPASPIRSAEWPTSSEITSSFGETAFGAGHSWASFFQACNIVSASLGSSIREFWGLVLGFAVRQFRYSEIVGETAIVERLDALIAIAVVRLRET